MKYITVNKDLIRIPQRKSANMEAVLLYYIPVSYTHLDVYKRQLWFLSKFGIKPMHFFGLLGSLMFLIGMIFVIIVGVSTVSYTHLDSQKTAPKHIP